MNDILGIAVENLGVYHESRPLTPKLGVSDRVRLHVVFVCSVHSATSAVLAVVGDGRSGDPLHERDDKRDVYEGEVDAEGRPHGKGTMKYASGDVYEGEYKDDKKHGRGKQVWPNGDIYDGQWLNNYAHGEGTMYFTKNKQVHKGSYYEGV